MAAARWKGEQREGEAGYDVEEGEDALVYKREGKAWKLKRTKEEINERQIKRKKRKQNAS